MRINGTSMNEAEHVDNCKSRKPKCTKRVKSLPCQYRSQKKPRIDSEIFADYKNA